MSGKNNTRKRFREKGENWHTRGNDLKSKVRETNYKGRFLPADRLNQSVQQVGIDSVFGEETS